MTYPRDLIGYGANPPDPKWPDGARLALNFVLNYEEGSEYNVLEGDAAAETYIGEVPVASVGAGKHDFVTESLYEYGSCVGFWRVLRACNERRLTMTVFGCGLALERNPPAAKAIRDAGYDVCSHGWRWISHHLLSEAEERTHIRKAIDAITQAVGERPLGWYCRYAPSANTRRLVVEEGGFLYDSDSYADDLPLWTRVGQKPHLVIPYTFTNNYAKFTAPPGFGTSSQFFEYLKDAFDVYYREGAHTPRMMSVGLHARFAGHPGRFAGLERFLDYVSRYDDV
jgi:peptidoglycan/xylan/chitin deacetylase (PgdA/CDA1 family)